MEKILYTRCSPWIDLLSQGKIVRQEGFGVAGTSPNLFTVPANFKLLKRLLEDRKGDMNNFEKIYEYVEVGNDVYAFICSGELPVCKEPRKNGSGHRPIFMAEAIVGKFPVSPALYMSPENFKGDALSQNDYYRMDLGPETQPLPLNPVELNALKESDVFFAINPQRATTLASLLSYVIDELGKPEAKRTVLFIKADNSEVIGYVDAIARNLPSSLARKFTFLTHTSSFKSNPERYSYYNLTQTGEVMEYNAYAEEAAKANRKLKYLLVGYTQGMVSRNPRSEFHHLDLKAGQCSFQANPGTFLTALAIGDPMARKCLAYINEHLGGVLPANRDAFYGCWKILLSDFSGEVSKENLENALRYFLSSEFASNEAAKAQAVAKIQALYPGLLAQDMASGFSLLGLGSKLDPNLRNLVLPKIEADLAAKLDDPINHPDVIASYKTLEQSGVLAQIEKNLLANHIRVATLNKLVRECKNDELVMFYFQLFLKKLPASPVPATEETALLQTYGAMLSRYPKNTAILNQIDMLLRPYGEKRDQIYSQLITNAHKENRHDDVETYLRLYHPNLDFKQTQIMLARMIKELTFGQFENKLIKAITANPALIPTATDTLFALFEVYPDAKRKELNSGLVYGDVLVKAIGDRVDKGALMTALNYLIKLKAIRGELPETMIKGLEDKLMRFVLQDGPLAEFAQPLTELGIEKPAKLAALKAEVVKGGVAEQQKTLEEFAKAGGYPIKPSDLRLPYFVSMLKALKFEKSYVHVTFLMAFGGEDPKAILPSYLTVLQELRKPDGFLFYHSLCLAATLETEGRPSTKKAQEAFEALLNTPDSQILADCYNSKYEKRLGELPESTPASKKAKERLVKDFSGYGSTHKTGFFARIFGKK